MGDLHDLTTGPVSPTIAMIFATLGSLLGILLITQARRRTGWRRVRLVAYATLTLALSAVFLPALVTVLALRVDRSVLLLALAPLAYSLGAATGGSALALVLVCWGRPGPFRQVLAGVLLVGAIGATGIFMATSLTTGVPIGARTEMTGVALAGACVTGFGLAAALAATRTIRLAVGIAVLLGLSLAAVYHVAAAGLTLQTGVGDPIPADDVMGLSPLRIGLPAVISIAVIVAMTWYFTLGAATARDLRLMFEPAAQTEQIEPWMIEQVRTRVALSSTAHAPISGWSEVWAQHEPTVAIHEVSIIGRGIASAFARALPGRSSDPVATTAEPSGQDTAAREPRDDASMAWRPVPGWGIPTAEMAETDIDSHTYELGLTDGPDLFDDDPELFDEDADLIDDLYLMDGPDPMDADDDDDDEAAWPAPSRNESGVARRGGMIRVNHRYGPEPGGAEWPDRTHTPVASVDPAAWAARVRALSAAQAAAEGRDGGVAIVHEYVAGSSLPRRNARPIHRP